MESGSMSCYGRGPNNTLSLSFLTPQYHLQSASPLNQPSAHHITPRAGGRARSSNVPAEKVHEGGDTLSALRETAPRLPTIPSVSEHGKQRMPMPLRARSSLGSVRSKNAKNYSITTSAVNLSADITPSTDSLANTKQHNGGQMQSQQLIAQLTKQSTINISSETLEEDVAKPRKKSGIKSIFSFASLSKQSSRNSIDTTRSDEDLMPSAASPTRDVNEWLAMQNNEVVRPSSSSTGSGASSSILTVPNARRATNSVASQQSTVDRMSTSSRSSSSFTRLSTRMFGAQRLTARTPSPETPTIDEGAEAVSAESTKPALVGTQRASSPAPSRSTRRLSFDSVHDDAVICDAATTSFISAGRPKSIYDYQRLQGSVPAAFIKDTTTVTRPMASRPRPQLLQLASKAIDVEDSKISPSSATSSVPSLTSSYTPSSTSPPSTPGSPGMANCSDIMYFSKRSPVHSWLDEQCSTKGATSAPSASPSCLPSSTTTSTSTQTAGLSARHSSLSPFTATMLKAAAQSRTGSVAQQPTQRSQRTQNPYTTTPTAPFPSPSTSPSSPYSSASSTSPTEASYFRLPASSSAHPSLYPDLIVKGRQSSDGTGATVGMDLTEEEAVLIASLRRKRMAMRREELTKLGKALGVTREESESSKSEL